MSATHVPPNRGEMVMSRPDFCEQCGDEIAAGDRMAFAPSKTPGRYRYWHEKCFDANLTPLKDWPKSTAKR